jgi:hypothetical protein
MEGSQKQLDPKEESAYKRSIQTVSKIYNSSTGFQNKPRRPFADTKSSYIPVMTTSGMNSPVFTTNGTNIGQRKFSASNKTTESYASQVTVAKKFYNFREEWPDHKPHTKRLQAHFVVIE